MEEYLKNTLELLKTDYYTELNLVIGNESCDLDSAVSAIVYGTFLYWQYDKIKCCKVCTRFNRDEVAYKDEIFMPILNVDREDYPLKTEVVYCLNEVGISENNLLFRDDLNLEELIKNSKVKVTLVDHHTLAGKDKFLAPNVTEIIDHRPIDKTNWDYKDDTRSTIEVVGSCCTLVTQRIRDLSALIATEEDFFKDFRVCCDMLHSTIILDTVNFSKEVDKATRHDFETISFLENILKTDNIECVRKSKLARFVSARSDVTALTAGQLLRKDVKMFGDVLVPSFPLLVKDFLSLPNAAGAVSGALQSRGGSVALLLGMALEGGLQRDMAVWSPDTDKSERLCQFLTTVQPSLDLSADKLPNSSDNKLAEFKYYTQQNLRASRKQSTIEVVGSCCTLVAQRIRDLSALIATEEDFFKDFRVCCDMLHSTIILDTVNFSKEVDKATRHDFETISFLENILKTDNIECVRKSKLARFVSARSDVTALTAGQLLRKDVKMFGDVLVPSFPLLVKDFLSLPNATGAVSGALQSRGGSVALLLGMALEGGLQRDMAVWSPDTDKSERLCQFLTTVQPSLDLLADKLPNSSDNKLAEFKYYTQQNLRASRKQYIPALMKFLEG